jgi:hypothetical protein
MEDEECYMVCSICLPGLSGFTHYYHFDLFDDHSLIYSFHCFTIHHSYSPFISATFSCLVRTYHEAPASPLISCLWFCKFLLISSFFVNYSTSPCRKFSSLSFCSNHLVSCVCIFIFLSFSRFNYLAILRAQTLSFHSVFNGLCLLPHLSISLIQPPLPQPNLTPGRPETKSSDMTKYFTKQTRAIMYQFKPHPTRNTENGWASRPKGRK